MSDGSPKLKAPSKSTFHFLAGLSSGILSAVLLQPIDLLKTRVQQSGHHSLTQTLATLRSSPKGLASLYRGTVPSALRTGLGSAIYFTSLNAIRSHATGIPSLAQNVPSATDTASSRAPSQASSSSNLPRLSPTGNLLTGATARGFAGFLLMPLTVIKVRYESSLYGYTSIAHAARDIVSREGVRGLFAGVGATALRDAPYAGLYVLFYEESKKILGGRLSLRDRRRGAPPGDAETGGRMGVSRAAVVNFSSGALAATACSIVSNPFDAVKTRIQLQPGVYRNMWHAARRMVGPEEGRGVRALFDGLGLRVSRKALSSALAWTVYEELIRRAEGSVVGKPKERKDVL